jgi:hypothetical protein
MKRSIRQINLNDVTYSQVTSAVYQWRMCGRKKQFTKDKAITKSRAKDCQFYKCLFCDFYHLTTKKDN